MMEKTNKKTNTALGTSIMLGVVIYLIFYVTIFFILEDSGYNKHLAERTMGNIAVAMVLSGFITGLIAGLFAEKDIGFSIIPACLFTSIIGAYVSFVSVNIISTIIINPNPFAFFSSMYHNGEILSIFSLNPGMIIFILIYSTIPFIIGGAIGGLIHKQPEV